MEKKCALCLEVLRRIQIEDIFTLSRSESFYWRIYSMVGHCHPYCGRNHHGCLGKGGQAFFLEQEICRQ